MKLSDADYIAIAKARYNVENAPVDYRTLARELRRDKAGLCRAVNYAFRHRLVEVREVERHSTRRVGELEQKLQEAFNLLGAIVIDTTEGDPHSNGGSPEPMQRDKVHAILGGAMSELIATGAMFRDSDCIGLGSGRGVYYTVEALARRSKLRASNVTIVSLTGDVYAQDHAKIINSKMDADEHARLFSMSFVGKVHVYFMGSRILYTDEPIREAVRNRTWSDPNWPKISHALVGVGTLTAGHRFFDEQTTGQAEKVLAPIYKELEELIGLCRRASIGNESTYCPVADISNNLFYVRPPAGVTVPRTIEDRIRQLIASINPQLLNIPEESLKQTGTVLLVAGSRLKALAIRELLTSEPYHIRFLCTDRAAAEVILKEVEG